MTGAPVGSVVIPAHNEGAVIARCLTALARQEPAAHLEIVVAANGCTDDTVDLARSFTDALPGLVVLDLESPSKVGALNAADEACSAFPRIYLDADIELGPTVVAHLLQVLARQEPALAGPSIVFDVDAASAAVRHFYRAYAQTPYVQHALVGLGVYALNAAGRARFHEFPALVADDLFVQRLFAATERHTVEGSFTVRVPRTLLDLVRVRTRTAYGNTQLQTEVPATSPGDGSSTWQTVLGLLGAARRRPTLLPSLGVYLAVIVAARLRARRTQSGTWWRDDSTRQPGSGAGPRRVAYLVSQYPSPSHTFIEREIAAVRSHGIVVDLFSVRATPPDQLLSEVMRAEAAQTVVVQDSGAVLGSVARTGLRHPLAMLRALRRAVHTGPAGARLRLWQVFYLAEATHLLHRMRQRGLRHVHVHFANNGADIARAAIMLARDVAPSQSWSWSFSMHGPTEFEDVERFDLAAKVASADAVACITDFARDQLIQLSPRDTWDKLHLVPMSVDVDRFTPVVRARRPGSALRVLFVGRLVPEKGPSILLEALEDLRRRGTAVEARFAGDGPLRGTLEGEVRRRGLSSTVHLLGALGQDDVLDLYAWADVFCLPSFREGLPVVLMEAMATGLPVLTTPIAGIPELVDDGLTGLSVPPGRPDLLADALLALAGDPARRQSLGEHGRHAVVERHSTMLAGQRQAQFLETAAAPWN